MTEATTRPSLTLIVVCYEFRGVGSRGPQEGGEISTGYGTGGKKVSQYRILSKMSLFEALYLLPVDSNMTHSFCIAHATIFATLLRFHQLQNMRCNGRYPGLKLAISEDGKTPCCSPFQWLLAVSASNEAQ